MFNLWIVFWNLWINVFCTGFNDFKKRKDFCIRCIKRIFKDYPEYKEVIMDIKELKEYLNEL